MTRPADATKRIERLGRIWPKSKWRRPHNQGFLQIVRKETYELMMAFQPQGQESQNRRILQDLQQKRQMLLNQGQGALGNAGQNLSAGHTSGPEASTSTPSVKPHEATVIRNPQAQRQALEHANATSSGYFISQDSAYGNLILPVLPRFENGELKMN